MRLLTTDEQKRKLICSISERVIASGLELHDALEVMSYCLSEMWEQSLAGIGYSVDGQMLHKKIGDLVGDMTEESMKEANK